MITLVVMNKEDGGSVTGDATVGVQFLADQCKKNELNVSSVWVRMNVMMFSVIAFYKHLL